MASAEAVCVVCGGSGWRIIERGGVSAAERCECSRRGDEARRMEYANLPPLYRDKSFENFSRREENPIEARPVAETILKVWKYAQSFPLTEKPGLLLIGPPGTGKTHLVVAVMRELLKKRIDCVFFDFNSLLNHIRESWDASTQTSRRDAYQQALDAEVLVIDDLGAHRAKDWIQDVLTSIITHRCNYKKPLIATTNLPDPDAGGSSMSRSRGGEPEYRRTLGEWIGERARSRLFEMCHVIRMPEVEDYRIRGRK